MIETRRLIISEAGYIDIPAVIELESHEDNRDYLWIGTEEEHRSEIEDPEHLLLMFRKKEDRKTIGYALVRLNRESEIFELRRIAISDKRKGYGRESMKALLKHAFEEMNINRFWLEVLRQSYKSERGYLNQIIYSMLREKYFSKGGN